MKLYNYYFSISKGVFDIANNKISLEHLSISSVVCVLPTMHSHINNFTIDNVISGTALPIGQSRIVRAQAGVPHEPG